MSRPVVELVRVQARDAAGPSGRARGALAGASIALDAGVHAFLGRPEDGLLALADVITGSRTPLRGRVTVIDRDPASTPFVRARIGALAPEPRLPDARTVRDAVRIAMQARGESGDRFDAVLDPLGLSSLQARAPRSLAFAEQRAVELALALSTPAPFLLALHEPLADVALPRLDLLPLRLREAANTGACVVITTSSPADARALADHVVVLHNGVVAREARGGGGLVIGDRTTLRVWVRGAGARDLCAELARRTEVRAVSFRQSEEGQGDDGAVVELSGDSAEVCAPARRSRARDERRSRGVRRAGAQHRRRARVDRRPLEADADAAPGRAPAPGHPPRSARPRNRGVTDDSPSGHSLPEAVDRETLPGSLRDDLPPLSRVAPPAASARMALVIGFATGRARIARRPTAVSALLGAALVLVAALVERRVGSAGAVDRALAGAFNVVVPLVSFGVAAEVCARGNLRDGVWAVARYGIARRDVALGAIGAGLCASAALSALCTLLAVGVAHAAGNPPLFRDAITSAWIAALTAAAYTSWFCAGATFGRRGGGRWVPLVGDFVLGSAPGVVGAILPRAHAANLLGGAAPLGLPQGGSSAVLVGSTVVLTLVAALRCRG
jgi:ABC-2 type transport system ATP-binding protein